MHTGKGNESGKNALLTLPTELISDFVFRIPVARTDFNNAYRLLTDDQKAILDEALLPFSSRMKTYMVDVKDQEDLRQEALEIISWDLEQLMDEEKL